MVTAAGVIVVGLAYLAERKATEVARETGQAINPINDDNIFNRGVNAVGAKLTGNENFQLGSWIAKKIHG
ncbi:hypothetical protein theurythT_03440 [Thalassotalea eurytherma]|uniref:Uncharacterized protein n=2 Tax=Thalassotalea eurytherma TaxID=1144278 RepID=A0ABQ6GYF8_9GAMM|nr:hypothetical protein theurythT_03440 [Thalassotalea eurytherma]